MCIKNCEIGYCVSSLAPFIANSSYAIKGNNLYIVNSYNTTILIVDTKAKQITFNKTFYSTTTSRLQNTIRKELHYFCGYTITEIDDVPTNENELEKYL